MELHILVCGKTGVGKSTLINSILGEDLVPTGGPGSQSQQSQDGRPFKSLSAVTAGIVKASGYIQGVSVTIYDSPGLQDGTCKDESYLDQMSKVLDVAYLILYCFDMTTTRWLPADQNAIELITKRFGMTFWSKSILVLTKANQFQLSKRYSDPAKISEWEKTCEKAFNDIADPFKAQLNGLLPSTEHCKVDNIPVIAAGSCESEPKERELIFVAPGITHMDYLSELWVQCLKRLPPDELRLLFLQVTDFKSVQVSPNMDVESIKTNIQKAISSCLESTHISTRSDNDVSSLTDAPASISASIENPVSASQLNADGVNTSLLYTDKPCTTILGTQRTSISKHTCRSDVGQEANTAGSIKTTSTQKNDSPLMVSNSKQARPKSTFKPAVPPETNTVLSSSSTLHTLNDSCPAARRRSRHGRRKRTYKSNGAQNPNDGNTSTQAVSTAKPDISGRNQISTSSTSTPRSVVTSEPPASSIQVPCTSIPGSIVKPINSGSTPKFGTTAPTSVVTSEPPIGNTSSIKVPTSIPDSIATPKFFKAAELSNAAVGNVRPPKQSTGRDHRATGSTSTPRPVVTSEPPSTPVGTTRSTQASKSMPDTVARNQKSTGSTSTPRPVVTSEPPSTPVGNTRSTATTNTIARNHSKPTSTSTAELSNASAANTSLTQQSTTTAIPDSPASDKRSTGSTSTPLLHVGVGVARDSAGNKFYLHADQSHTESVPLHNPATSLSTAQRQHSRRIRLDERQSRDVVELTNESLVSIIKRYALIAAKGGAAVGSVTISTVAVFIPSLSSLLLPRFRGLAGAALGGAVGGTVGATVGLVVGLWRKWWE